MMSDAQRRAELRIGDAERHRVAELLRDAAGEGRLEPDELEERLDATFAAKVHSDLVPLLADLPSRFPESGPVHRIPDGQVVPFAATVPYHPSTLVYGARIVRDGPWATSYHHRAIATLGSAVLDLRHAQFPQQHVTFSVRAYAATIEIVVHERTQVFFSGGTQAGFFDHRVRDEVAPLLDASSPSVTVCGRALMGRIAVTRRALAEP